jgi:predicted nucleic acid-binding protein
LTALLDASLIVAAADASDLNHRAAVAWLERVDEPLVIGAMTLADADHLLQRGLGPAAIAAVIQAIADGSVGIAGPTSDDLVRAIELMSGAVDQRPRLADAVLVATAERLGVRRIGTFDRRPLAVLRPRGSRTFDLEP